MSDLIDANEMPSPRLELRWQKTGATWDMRECVYGLVLPLREGDIRRENGDGSEADERLIEIGRTKCTGGTRYLFTEADEEGKPHIDTPFRDSAHAKWDSEALGGLPIYAVFGDKALAQALKED